MLQMAVKAFNDTYGPKVLVATLLVFGAFTRMSEFDPPAPSTIERANVIKAAMKEVRKCHSMRQVLEALRMRNGPCKDDLYRLHIKDEVFVWRKKDGWTGPFKMLSINGSKCIVSLPNGPTVFRSTVAKPFHNDNLIEDDNPDHTNPLTHTSLTPNSNSTTEIQKSTNSRPQRHKRQLPIWYREDLFTFLSQKEILDLEISKKLRQKGIITTHGKLFQISQRNEIDSLITNEISEFVP